LAEQKDRDNKDRQLREAQQKSQEMINQAQLLQKLFVFVSSDDPQKREFGYAMFGAMGQGELAARLIEIKGDKAGIKVLKTLAADKNPQISKAANAGLATLAALENVTSTGGAVLSQRSSCRQFAEAGFRTSRVEAGPSDIIDAAKKIDVEPEALTAFLQVQARTAVLKDGRSIILFERHVFSRLTGGAYDSSNPDISNPQAGGYLGGPAEYQRLTRAAALNCPAALASTSWGMFQILGNNAKNAGFEHVDDYVKMVMRSGKEELAAGIAYLRNAGLIKALQEKNWYALSLKYNGPFTAKLYSRKMELNYSVLKHIPAPESENLQ